MPEHVEIERTWLVDQKDIPDGLLYGAKVDRIVQGYVTPDNNDDPTRTTYRLRRKDDAYFFTWKHGGTTVRLEYEVQLTKEQYQVMWNMVGDQVVEKTRHTTKFYDPDHNPHLESFMVELDVFEGEHHGLVLVEVEFPSEEDAEKFVAPDWFGRDVTDEDGYSNYSLAVNGTPRST